MPATMGKASWVGLAAPQIGQSIRLFVVEDQEDF
jgi:peptide deformylase